MKLDTTPPIVKAIYEAYTNARRNAHRPHLGGSQIGHSCSRALWYQFRWTWREEHPGRILRLFETGVARSGSAILRQVCNLDFRHMAGISH